MSTMKYESDLIVGHNKYFELISVAKDSNYVMGAPLIVQEVALHTQTKPLIEIVY